MKQLTDIVLATMPPSPDEIYAEGGRPSIAPEWLRGRLVYPVPVFDPLESRPDPAIDFNMLYRWS